MQPAAEAQPQPQPFASYPQPAADVVDVEPDWQAPVEPAWQTPVEPACEPLAAASCEAPVGAAHRRAPAPPRIRGDHRSIAHVHGAAAHDTGRRRRASLRLRLLERCRDWLSVTH